MTSCSGGNFIILRFDKKGKSIKYFKARVIVSSLFMIFYFFFMTSTGYAENVRVTIAHTNNLNGVLFASNTSG